MRQSVAAAVFSRKSSSVIRCLHTVVKIRDPNEVSAAAQRRAYPAKAPAHFVNDERAFLARVIGELTRRLFNGAAHNLHADFLVAIEAPHVVEHFLRTD